MICDKCKKHIERKFLSNGKTVNCLYYGCERPQLNKGMIECTRDEICDYIYQILQPERSKREELILYEDILLRELINSSTGEIDYSDPTPFAMDVKTFQWLNAQQLKDRDAVL